MPSNYISNKTSRQCCDHCQMPFGEMDRQQRGSHSRWCNKNPFSSENRKLAKRGLSGEKVAVDSNLRPQYVKLKSCLHCDLDFTSLGPSERANHSRWCDKNPKRNNEENRRNPVWMQTPEVIAKRTEKIRQAHRDGVYAGAGKKALATKIRNGNLKPTEQALANMRIAASKATHQRLTRNAHDFTDKRGRTFKFDSSWEDHLARRLDELDVNWDRPPFVPYVLDGKSRKYFPDFYLPDHDVYLDPKNPYHFVAQQPKLVVVSKMINLVILITVKECKEYTPPSLSKKSRARKRSVSSESAVK